MNEKDTKITEKDLHYIADYLLKESDIGKRLALLEEKTKPIKIDEISDYLSKIISDKTSLT
ncbi:hypothetical protein IM33_08570 [Clostridioides difficile]|nr:hypothetical protein IM33_08570 [Clostridioides difficile]